MFVIDMLCLLEVSSAEFRKKEKKSTCHCFKVFCHSKVFVIQRFLSFGDVHYSEVFVNLKCPLFIAM